MAADTVDIAEVDDFSRGACRECLVASWKAVKRTECLFKTLTDRIFRDNYAGTYTHLRDECFAVI